tara:strand:+ start:685 stop:1239 length:555 start_codon:yes stop_codon:yes gene_type:complete
MPYMPPFELTHTMMRLVAEISQQVGEWTATNKDKLVPKLIKENRIRTIQASLPVEQNTLSLEQVTALVDGKTVLGSPKEIQEVHNAFAVYELMDKWNETSGDDLLEAHAIMMKGLLTGAGQWRCLYLSRGPISSYGPTSKPGSATHYSVNGLVEKKRMHTPLSPPLYFTTNLNLFTRLVMAMAT